MLKSDFLVLPSSLVCSRDGIWVHRTQMWLIWPCVDREQLTSWGPSGTLCGPAVLSSELLVQVTPLSGGQGGGTTPGMTLPDVCCWWNLGFSPQDLGRAVLIHPLWAYTLETLGLSFHVVPGLGGLPHHLRPTGGPMVGLPERLASPPSGSWCSCPDQSGWPPKEMSSDSPVK